MATVQQGVDSLAAAQVQAPPSPHVRCCRYRFCRYRF
jgi:hypothetical protein